MMKEKFDKWVEGWSDGTLLIYFTALAALQTSVVIFVLG
tara:strand:+ start:472 stop:588 length:117 start_codon:yes stop_codon:yes gene_type:complete